MYYSITLKKIMEEFPRKKSNRYETASSLNIYSDVKDAINLEAKYLVYKTLSVLELLEKNPKLKCLQSEFSGHKWNGAYLNSSLNELYNEIYVTANKITGLKRLEDIPEEVIKFAERAENFIEKHGIC